MSLYGPSVPEEAPLRKTLPTAGKSVSTNHVEPNSQFRTDLDFARFQWVSGRIAGGLGRLEEAATLLLQARGMFSAKGLAFEMALVSLELAFLYSQAGRTEAVKDIARHLAPLFKAQALPRETLAALGLFRQAAEAGRVSAEFAQQVLLFVRRARYNPRMVFTPA